MHSIWLRMIGGAAIVAVSFFGTLWLMDRAWGPACPRGTPIDLKRPFSKIGINSYLKEGLLVAGDTPQSNSSTLVLCEGHTVLGPAHSAHADVSQQGSGRFSHWGNSLVFSTSDNSDPNVNRRNYALVKP